MSWRVSVEPRARPALPVRVGVPVASLAAAALVGGIVILISGNSPIEAYRTMVDSSLNGLRPITRTLLLATPLILTGLAAAVAFRMKVWNIGAEGQLYMGAIAASGLALWLPAGTPKVVMLAAMIAGGAAVGALWAGVAALPKAYFNTNEVITTLMLNFVALYFMNYLIFGTVSFWRDPGRNYPQGKLIPDAAELPIISHRLHYGLVIALVAALVMWWSLRGTTWGFELRTIGDSPSASRYAGMSVSGKILSVLALSGALAGVAGAIEVSGVLKSLDPPGADHRAGLHRHRGGGRGPAQPAGRGSGGGPAGGGGRIRRQAADDRPGRRDRVPAAGLDLPVRGLRRVLPVQPAGRLVRFGAGARDRNSRTATAEAAHE